MGDKRHIRTLLLTFGLIVGLATAWPAMADAAVAGPNDVPDSLTGEYIVGFEPGTRAMDAQNVAMTAGADAGEWIPALGALVVRPRVGTGLADQALTALGNAEGVRYIEPNGIVRGSDTPNDPYYPTHQWGPQRINAETGWDTTTGSSSVVVAVLDTGLDMAHAEFSGEYVTGYDFVNADSDPSDDHGHGTHVSGIVGATTNNGVGVASVGRQTVIMPVKVLNSSNSGTVSMVAQGIEWATDNGADIVNLSLGTSTASTTLENAVNYASSNGVLVVAAAGNENSSSPFYPAAYSSVIGVTAIDQYDARWSLSNYGNWVSLAAPGSSIYSTDWVGGAGAYAFRSGTSMAAPHVTAVAALMLAVDGTLTPADLHADLESTAIDLGPAGFDDEYGHGLVDAAAAVAAAVAGGGSSDTPTPTPTSEPTSGDSSSYLQLVNAGGASYTDTSSVLWSADTAYSSSTWGYTSGTAASSSNAVAGTLDDALFQAYRSDPGEYRFDVPSGTYDLTLHFAEFEASNPNHRQMSITAEGVTLESSLSIAGTVGMNTALSRAYTVSVSDGVLNIAFARAGGPNPPVVSAIQVVSQDTGTSGGQDPTATPTDEPTATPTDEPTLAPSPTPEPTSTPSSTTEGARIADLDANAVSSGGSWLATVTVLVVDHNGLPVSDATVSGSWSFESAGTSVCLTDAAGLCSVNSGWVHKKNGTTTYTVSDVSHATLSYLSGQNSDPDGDSDGTQITVTKP